MGVLNRARIESFVRRLRTSKFARDTAALQAGKLIVTALASLSYLLTLRLLGPQEYGVFGLAQGLITLLYTLDLTGVGTATSTRLGIAIGERNPEAVLDLLAVFVRVSVIIHTVGLAILWALGAVLAAALYESGARVGTLAAVLAVSLPADALYVMIATSLQARRQMRALALLQIANQGVLTACIVAALLIQASADSLVIGRVIFSYGTMLLAWGVYRRLRGETDLPFPTLKEVFQRARTVRLRGHLGFGFANAVDKGFGNFLTQLPLQMVGALAGERAAGYLVSALNGISHLNLLTSAIFDNMQAVVPQRVGQRDYRGLWHVVGRVLLVLLVVGLGVYGVLVLITPLGVPLLLGEAWAQLTPVLVVLAVFGVVTTVGGIFGPLYRALNRLWSAVLWKGIALIVALGTGSILLSSPGAGSAGAAALTGAWMINIAFAVSVVGSGWISLRALRRAKETERT